MQKLYITIERNLLFIIEILKEYCNMLLSIDIIIIIDHKNLLLVNTIFL